MRLKNFVSQQLYPRTEEGGGGGRYSGFQVTGMIGFLLGLKFLIPGFFWVGKNGKYFFGWLDLSRDIFLGIQNNLKICGSARVSRPRSSANKVQPNLVLAGVVLFRVVIHNVIVETENVLGCPQCC